MGCWKSTVKLPIRSLSLESAYSELERLAALGTRGAEIASRLRIDVPATSPPHNVLDQRTYELPVDAIVTRWQNDDPRWDLLENAP